MWWCLPPIIINCCNDCYHFLVSTWPTVQRLCIIPSQYLHWLLIKDNSSFIHVTNFGTKFINHVELNLSQARWFEVWLQIFPVLTMMTNSCCWFRFLKLQIGIWFQHSTPPRIWCFSILELHTKRFRILPSIYQKLFLAESYIHVFPVTCLVNQFSLLLASEPGHPHGFAPNITLSVRQAWSFARGTLNVFWAARWCISLLLTELLLPC